MQFTPATATRWAKRLHTTLNQPDAAERFKTLTGTKEILADAAGCASWHSFDAHLRNSAGTSRHGLLAEDSAEPCVGLECYPVDSVRRAIVKSLAVSFPDGWGRKAADLADFLLTAHPTAGSDFILFKKLIDFDYLWVHSNERWVTLYFEGLPEFPHPRAIQGDQEINDVRWQPGTKGAKEQHGYRTDLIYRTLQRWDLLLDPGAATILPPVTLDILMRCVAQKVEWPNEWIDWFRAVRG